MRHSIKPARHSSKVRRLLSLLLLLLPLSILGISAPGHAQDVASSGMLEAYLAAPDASYAWKLVGETKVPAEPPYTRYSIELTSQTWRGNAWTHNLLVFVPEAFEHPETVMLTIGGGTNQFENGPPKGASSPEAFILPPLATRGRVIVALLSQVPNQPILGGLNEDQAIAHTFSQYLATGEEDWPLLLPMTKSAIRAMDAIQSFASETLDVEVEKFMVTGASKRGWTTWLTAATDPRVAAIAPLVIDNLNIAKQMPHQIESWGAYSPSIADYTKLNLQEQLGALESKPENGEGRDLRLLRTIDPYFYRDRLTLPKLVQSSTNDPYWVLDASRFYFPELGGEKFLHFSPNTAHTIDLEGVMSIGGFFHYVRSGAERPKFDWTVAENAGGETLEVVHNHEPQSVRLWSAEAPTRDFRQAQWISREIEPSDAHTYRVQVEAPEAGYRAYYAELVYEVEPGVTMGLCTEMRLVGSE